MQIRTPLKKILALALCLALTTTLLSGAALAVETFTTSDACIAMIKELEGYRQMPYADNNGKWYVGYAVECDPADYPAGVTEEEADLLLRAHLVANVGEMVNRFLPQYGIPLTKYQSDAMVRRTYTLSCQWINPE